MRHLAAAVALLFAASPQSEQTAHPQLAAAPPPLVEKIDVSVVNIDVAVTDRRGVPVRGLTRNDFEIFEDGKAQAVSNFFSVENAQARREIQTEAPAEQPPPESVRRRVLVLVDNVNTSVRGRNEALAQLGKFIDQHFDDGHYDWSVAAIDSRIHLLLPMTSDKTVLQNVVARIRRGGTQKDLRSPIAALETAISPLLSGAPTREAIIERNETSNPDSIMQQQQQLRDESKSFLQGAAQSEQTMFAQSSTRAMIEAARAFGSSEGRKIILLVTGNLPLGESPALGRVGAEARNNHAMETIRANNQLVRFRDQIIQEANASNTSLYVINAEGLEVPSGTENVSARDMGTAPQGSDAPDTSAMYWMGRETGGAYMPGNRIDQSLADFDRRSANFYSLGYRTKLSDDTRYHRLVVRVKAHSEYRLQYRDGYSSATTDLQLARSLRSSLAGTMQHPTLSMSLTVGDPQYRGVIAFVPLKAAMSMESLQYIKDTRGSRTRLHVYVSVFDREGRNITLAKSYADIAVQPNESATGPMTVTIPPLALAKGTYRVVVAVRDELTDHIGVAEKNIDV